MFCFVVFCMTIRCMKPKKSAQMCIRIDDEFQARIKKFEDKTGVPMATLVRAATEAALNYYDEAESITFPLKCEPLRKS